jgi:DNA processing protein
MLGVSSGGPTGGSERASDLSDDRPRPGPKPAPTSPADLGDRDAWAVLASVHRLGPVGFGALLGRYGSGVAILHEAASPRGVDRLAETLLRIGPDERGREARRLGPAVARAIAEATTTAHKTLGRIRSLGVEVVTVDDVAYPRRLAAIDMPPLVLFVMGDIASLDARAAVAIVGTRRATDAGRGIASRIATNLVAVGATVVSGLAVGIDGAAHSATVRAGGKTIAVIGSGHALLRPLSHSRLAASIIDSGGAVVSELAPDVEATRGTFPRRNRVISGLSDATVVVEAPARSGALITASWALEQGRDCFLVPGPLGAAASEGCLAFLREFPGGARIVAGIPQLIDDLGLADHLASPVVTRSAAATLADVGEAAGRIGRELVLGRATVDELVATTGWPVASVLTALTLLERKGLAVGVHGRFRPAGGLAAADPAGVTTHRR